MKKKEAFFSIIGIIFLIISLGFIGFCMADEDTANVRINIFPKVTAPENFSIAINQSNGNALLNWSEVVNVDGYKIWYSDNVTEILQLHDNTNVTATRSANVTINNNKTLEWIDTDADQTSQRYYSLAAFDDERMRLVNYSVGKYDILIHDETNVWQTSVGLPLDKNIPVTEISAPNKAWILTVDETKNDTWIYAFNFYGTWYGDLQELELGKAYYFDEFKSELNLTSYGKVPTGNITRLIHDETHVRQTYLGWESINTNGTISELLGDAPNKAWILTVDETKNDTWIYDFNFYGTWYGDLFKFEAGKGYYFDEFKSEYNLTYERNPH